MPGLKILGFQDGGGQTNIPLGGGGDVSGSTGSGGGTVTGVGGIPVDVSGTTDGYVLTYVAASSDIELVAPGAISGFMTTSLGGKEDIHTVTSSGASQTLDLADGNVQDITLTASCTLTLAGATAGKACSMTLILRQGGSGSYTVTWPGSLVWPSGTAPTLATTVGQLDLVALLTLDGGTTWYGFHSGTGGSGGGVTVEDEGTPLATVADTLNFVGAGVTATGTGTTKTITIPGGAGAFVNVKDYGALGDNSHDDTSDITSAIAALPATGGCLYFPAGTYKITSTLSINKPGTLVLGDGSEYSGSVIHMVTANTTAIQFNPSWDGTRDQTCLMRGIWVKGPSPRYGATSGYGVNAASDVHLEDCSISAFYIGLHWYSATYYSRAYGCFFTDCASSGVYMDTTNNCIVDTCRFIGAYSSTGDLGPMQYGVAIYSPTPAGLANRVVNSSIEYFSLYGVSVNGGRAVEIIGNYFETQQSSSGGAHIKVGLGELTYATLIASNYLQGDGTSGFNAIATDHAQGVTIVSNFFGVNAAIGITSTANSTGFLLIGNEFTGTPTLTLPGSSYTLDPASPPLNNPMSAVGDLIRGGTSGVPQRVGIGATGQVLTISGGVPVWATPAPSGTGELVIEDGTSAPPVMLTNEAEDDFLYADL